MITAVCVIMRLLKLHVSASIAMPAVLTHTNTHIHTYYSYCDATAPDSLQLHAVCDAARNMLHQRIKVIPTALQWRPHAVAYTLYHVQLLHDTRVLCIYQCAL
jgi:hypothetical protein